MLHSRVKPYREAPGVHQHIQLSNVARYLKAHLMVTKHQKVIQNNHAFELDFT